MSICDRHEHGGRVVWTRPSRRGRSVSREGSSVSLIRKANAVSHGHSSFARAGPGRPTRIHITSSGPMDVSARSTSRRASREGPRMPRRFLRFRWPLAVAALLRRAARPAHPPRARHRSRQRSARSPSRARMSTFEVACEDDVTLVTAGGGRPVGKSCFRGRTRKPSMPDSTPRSSSSFVDRRTGEVVSAAKS